jgi:hypothetical protein
MLAVQPYRIVTARRFDNTYQTTINPTPRTR